jgi:hypothetical protein
MQCKTRFGLLGVFSSNYPTPCDQLLNGFTKCVFESALQLRLQQKDSVPEVID